MSGSSGLARLVRLYAMLERMRTRELRQASLAVEEVRQAEERSAAGRRADDAAGRRGLALGSWIEACAATAGREPQNQQRLALEKMRMLRTRDLMLAKDSYQRSLTELKQVETLLTSARDEAEQEEDRALQAASDDRFLSRREWMRKRALRPGA